jgi:hypothetical protein
MSRVREYRFDPGSLEAITLKLWRHPNRCNRQSQSYRVRGSVEGFFDVYCGAGNTHTVRISEELDFWTTDAGHDSIVGHAADVWLSKDQDKARELTHEVIFDLALGDWFCSCDSELDD